MTGVFCLFATGSAVGAEAIKLNPSVEQSLRQHPNVAEAKARVCQAIHRLGLDKARARPQVSLSISGGRQLIERVKGANGRPDDRGSAESGHIVNRSGLRVRDPSVDDDDISGAYKRDYRHRARNNIYDGTLTLRYSLVDWGQSNGAINAQKLRHLISRIEAENTLGDRSFQLLSIAINLSLFDRLLEVQQRVAEQIDLQVEAVNARVMAGAGRINDLREIKLLALDIEIETNKLLALRDQALESLEIEYGLNAQDVGHFLSVYLANRPTDLAYLAANETSCSRAFGSRLMTRRVMV